MFKWKFIFYILILFLININCQKEKVNIIELETEQIEYLSYNKSNIFTFEKTKKNDLLINLHSIDCEIKITNKDNNEIKKIKDNIFSILISNEQIGKQEFIVEAFINSGNNDKNKEYRECPLVINSLYKDEFKLNIIKKESMALSFSKDFPYVILSYKIKNNNDGFTTLSFLFDGNYTFNVDINNKINKKILNPSKIFFENSELFKKENKKLTIKITLNEENKIIQNHEPVIIFKLMESNSTSILEKNNLNLGFTYSKKDNQYFYLEVFKGEEGEIMIHNKRLFGELYGIIKPKSNTRGKIDPYHNTEYIKKDDNNLLQFDALTLKLSFKSYQTEQCEKGCYLFLKYSHDDYNSSNNDFIVGFEYTLLVRIWDEEETGSQIINIPFNEYIFGAFEQESINHHYYSLNIPNDTKEIIIQFEGNYIDGFLGSGKRKLNTFRNFNNTLKLNLTENKMILRYNKSQLEKLNTTDKISFAFRSKNYFNDIFSFYYFRILLLKNNESDIIYPLDSNIGTICSPKKENHTYICKCILKNDYNDFYLDYSISTSNKKDKLTYNYAEFIKGKVNNDTENILQASENNKFTLIKFQFENEKIANILSTLINNNKEIYPQIYSKQLYNLRNENNSFIFDLKRNYSLTLNYIQGAGNIKYLKKNIEANENFKGKPFFFQLNKSIKNIAFSCKKKLIFYTKIEEIHNIKEITLDETLMEFINSKKLPIYFYIKNEENDINQINVHYRIKIANSTDKNKQVLFTIYGYILNENEFINKRNLNGEFIDLENPYSGTYDINFRIGFLNINKKIKKGEYIVIEIDSYDNINEEILLEILSMSKKDEYSILPVNSYIADIYQSTGKNYKIIIDEEDRINKSILVEFIPDCSNMTIKENKDKVKDNLNDKMSITNISVSNETVQKYRISNFSNDFILKVDAPKNISYGNYIIRYYFTKIEDEEYYQLNYTSIKKKSNNTNDIILEFNELKLISNKGEIINNNNDNSFYIYGFLYSKENDIKNEFINSPDIDPKYICQNFKYLNKISNFSLYFSDIKNPEINDTNFIFYLYIKIYVHKKNNMFNEEFYVYTIPIDLRNELEIKGVEEKKSSSQMLWIIISALLGFLVIMTIITCIIIVTKLKKNNSNLKEKVLSISFSSGKIDDEIAESQNNSKKDEDYESTFI